MAPATGGLSLLGAGATAGLTGIGVGASTELVRQFHEINNGKGSTIKLTNEMSESNGKLGERDN